MTGETFKIVLLTEFFPYDMLNDSLIVLSTTKCENRYVSKVCTEEDLLHKQFLFTYRQYLWF